MPRERTKKSRKRGRPPLPPDQAKRHALGIRTTKTLKERIADAAGASGRSLAQEAEYRLEGSFAAAPDFDTWLARIYGPQCAALLQIIGRELPSQIVTAGIRVGAMHGTRVDILSDWMADPTVFAVVSRSINAILAILRPPGAPADVPDLDPESDAQLLMSKLAREYSPELLRLRQGLARPLIPALGGAAEEPVK